MYLSWVPDKLLLWVPNDITGHGTRNEIAHRGIKSMPDIVVEYTKGVGHLQHGVVCWDGVEARI